MARPRRIRGVLVLIGAITSTANAAAPSDKQAIDTWARHVYARSILASAEGRERLGLARLSVTPSPAATPRQALDQAIDHSLPDLQTLRDRPSGEPALSDAFWIGATRADEARHQAPRPEPLLWCALAEGAGEFDATSSAKALRRRHCWLNLAASLGQRAREHVARALTTPVSPAFAQVESTPRAPLEQWRHYLVDPAPAREPPAFARAVAVGVAAIDRPFQGVLRPRAPADGLFAVVDHAVPHALDAFGYPRRADNGAIFGFTRLRLNVERIDTPASTPTDATRETWIALARYHRNVCYRADLSGETQRDVDGKLHAPAECVAPGRSAFEDVSMSRAIVTLSQRGERALVFDFSDQPVPINATDLFVQVLRRGANADDLAVGMIDVREPTYLLAANHGDMARCQGQWHASDDLPRGCRAEAPAGNAALHSLRLCLGSQLVFEHLRVPHGDLAPGGFVRVAVLLDGVPRRARSRIVLDGPWPAQVRDQRLVGRIVQASADEVDAATIMTIDPLWRWRGLAASTFGLSYHVDDRRETSPVDATPPRAARAWDTARAPIDRASPGEAVFPELAVDSHACSRANDALTHDRALAGEHD